MFAGSVLLFGEWGRLLFNLHIWPHLWRHRALPKTARCSAHGGLSDPASPMALYPMAQHPMAWPSLAWHLSIGDGSVEEAPTNTATARLRPLQVQLRGPGSTALDARLRLGMGWGSPLREGSPVRAST